MTGITFMHTFSFNSEIWLPNNIDGIFAFFADARNLQAITPAWVHFEILTKDPIVIQPGSLIDYRLRIRGIPWRWQTRIDVWEPPHRFIDSQLKGPYRLWRHEHLFVSSGAGTKCTDHVEYAVAGGSLVDRLLVRPDVEKIFDFRREKLKQLFPNAEGGENDSWSDDKIF